MFASEHLKALEVHVMYVISATFGYKDDVHTLFLNSWYVCIKDRPRFFDQVGHQTTNTSIGNKHFFTK